MSGSLRAHLLAPLAAIRAVGGNSGLRSLLLASALQTTSRWILVVTMLLVAYDVAGPLGVGVVGLVRTLPAVATVPAAALLGGRRREHVLRALVAVRAAVVLVAAGTLAFGLPAVLFVATAIDAFAGTLRRPVHAGLMPSLARSPNELVAANVATSFAESVGGLVGPVAGGLLLAAAGPVWTLAAAALSLVTATALVATIRDVHGGLGHGASADGADEDGNRVETTEAGAPAGALGGLKTMARSPGVRIVGGLALLDGGLRGALTAAIVVLAVDRFADDGRLVGVLSGMPGLGGLAGVGVALALLPGLRLVGPLVASLAIVATGLALLAASDSPSLAAFVLVGGGLAAALGKVASTTLLQRAVSTTDRTPVLGALEGLTEGAVGFGSIGVTVLIGLLGLVPALALVGVGSAILVLAAWPALARWEHTLAPPSDAFELIADTPLFAPLPLDVLEALAARATHERFAAGDRLMTEGEAGDAVYLIEQGAVDVYARGVHLRGLAHGAAVGEIALLRSVPRTATVVARGEVTALRIDAATFVSAVSGQARARHHAEAVASAHLEADAGRAT